jgi:ribosomal protein S18 acetylase RimI-like enzyme
MTTYPIRRLTESDIPQLVKLSQAVEWQHDNDTWRQVVRWSKGYGYGIIHSHSKAILATAVGTPYEGGRGWIGMVITHPRQQGQGFATRLTQTVIRDFQAAGIREIILDASQRGRRVYQRLGFRPLYAVVKWDCYEADLPKPDFPGIRPYQPDDLPALIALDEETFGVPRPAMISDLVNHKDTRVWVELIEGKIAGFLMLRRGGSSLAKIAPCIHHDPAGAERLIQTALHYSSGTLTVTLPEVNLAGKAVLQANGFQKVTSTTRMLLGETPDFAHQPEKMFGIISHMTG